MKNRQFEELGGKATSAASGRFSGERLNMSDDSV